MVAPKLRFKEFSEDWGSKKIIELADYVDYRGKTPKKVESGVLLVTAKNIKQGYLDYSASQEFIEESAFDDVMRRGKVELNDVLITTEAPLGNVASVDRTDIALAQRVIKYRGKIGLLDNLFLKQKFLSESFQEILKSKATGGTVQGIKGSVLHQIPLIVPSKAEQTKIAAFLSAVDEKITQLTQKHQLLSQYKQGMMQKLFSQQIRFKADDGSEFGEWEEKKLGEISTTFSGGTPKSTNKKFYQGKIPFIKSGELSQKHTEQFINELALKESSAKLVKKGDLLYALYGATSGHVAISQIDGAINQAVLCIRSDLNTIYLLNFFLWKKDSILSTYLQGGQGNLSAAILKEILVPIPCLKEQTKIANFLSTINQKIDVVSEQLEQAKLWKKGLLQQMFV